MGMTLVVAGLCFVLGALAAWVVARREHDAARRVQDVELATARSQLAAREELVRRLEQQAAGLALQEEQLSQLLTTTRAEFARADADARSRQMQLDELRGELATREAALAASQQALSTAGAQLARAQGDLAAATQRAEGLQRAEGEAQAAATARAAAEATLGAAQARLAALERAEGDAQAAQTALATARASLEGLQARVAALEHLEAAHAQLSERAGRLQAELEAQGDLREAAEAKLLALEAAQRRTQELAEALARAESQLDAERARAAERAADAERARETMRLEFEALAQKLLEEKGRAMLEQGQKDLDGLLSPVKERLKAFEETIQKTYDQENRDRASLLDRLRAMNETQVKLHEDARALSKALTGDSKAQGDWGELVLERLLESAGLTEGREYRLQVDHRDDEGGAKRPDVIVYLPQRRALVIDAKCSLTAFVASSRAVDEAEREQDLDAHLASVRAHVKTLQKKDYTEHLEGRSLDVTFMFVPNEAAFHAALARAPRLFEEAFAQGVVLCSPTTLLAALQVVHHVWRSELQQQNAERIADAAGRMVDKLTLALEAFHEVGKKLDGAQLAWGEAKKRLATGQGNALAAANKLVELGARAKKKVQLEAVNRALGDDLDEPAAEPEPKPTTGQLELGTGELPQA
jgi:DNA recombination protein RmuC